MQVLLLGRAWVSSWQNPVYLTFLKSIINLIQLSAIPSHTRSNGLVLWVALLTMGYMLKAWPGGTDFLHPLPVNALNAWSGSKLLSTQYLQLSNILETRGSKGESRDPGNELPAKNSGQPLNFVRVTSPYPFDVDADSLSLSAETLCTTKAVKPDEGKQWKCYNRNQGHVEIDIFLPETKDARVFVAINQPVTIHYSPLPGTGKSTDPLSVHINQDHAIKNTISEHLRHQKKVREDIHRRAPELKVSFSYQPDDSTLQAAQAITFKMIHGHSQEEEQEFQEQINNDWFGVRFGTPTDYALVLSPDTSIYQENLNIRFPGMINSLPVDGGGGSTGGSQGQNEGTSSGQRSGESGEGDPSREEQQELMDVDITDMDMDMDITGVDIGPGQDIRATRNGHTIQAARGGPRRAIKDVREENCSICFSKFEISPDSVIAVLNCYHAFHDACIQEALSGRKKCPFCSTENVSILGKFGDIDSLEAMLPKECDGNDCLIRSKDQAATYQCPYPMSTFSGSPENFMGNNEAAIRKWLTLVLKQNGYSSTMYSQQSSDPNKYEIQINIKPDSELRYSSEDINKGPTVKACFKLLLNDVMIDLMMLSLKECHPSVFESASELYINGWNYHKNEIYTNKPAPPLSLTNILNVTNKTVTWDGLKSELQRAGLEADELYHSRRAPIETNFYGFSHPPCRLYLDQGRQVYMGRAEFERLKKAAIAPLPKGQEALSCIL